MRLSRAGKVLEEQRKIERVRSELAKLDTPLRIDVNILRVRVCEHGANVWRSGSRRWIGTSTGRCGCSSGRRRSRRAARADVAGV